MDERRVAAELVRLAKGLAAGCEKLPEGPMRDNCEKKKEKSDDEENSSRTAQRLPWEDVKSDANKALGVIINAGYEGEDGLRALNRAIGRRALPTKMLKYIKEMEAAAKQLRDAAIAFGNELED